MVHLLGDQAISRVLVFTRTKHGANRLSKQLLNASIRALAIHGNKSQSARDRALSEFKAGSLRVLVATDVAARGLDVDGISHVINYDMPHEPETYVHRVGRTARAGARGAALSFCSQEERQNLSRIERLMGRRVPVVSEHPFHAAQRASDPRPSSPTSAGSPSGARRFEPRGGSRGGWGRRSGHSR
jgi:ATP-dependent RNA helicase RhlE